MPIEMICTRCRLSIQVPSNADERKVLCPQCQTASMVVRFEASTRPSKIEVPRSRKPSARDDPPDVPATQPSPPAQPPPAAAVRRPRQQRRGTGAMLLLGGGLGVVLLGCAGILATLLLGRGRIDERLVGAWVFQPETSRQLSGGHFHLPFPDDLQDARWDFHADGTCVLHKGGEEVAGTWKRLHADDRAVKVRITFADRTSHDLVFAFSDSDHVVVDPPLCQFRREA